MTLQQLKYLLGIVDSGLNITAAAERLYTSQPGISRQLKLLEQELGLKLFARKGKTLASITPAGREVIERARRILQEVDNIRSLADELSADESGTLSIATTHTQARYVLPDIVRAFRERYPKVSLELHQGTSEQIAELVTSQQVDFAIASDAYRLFTDLVILPCYRWDRIVLVPQDHPLLERRDAVDLEALAAHPLVTYVFSATGESSFKRAFADRSLNPDVVFTARDADVIKTYVRMGMGVGIVASMAYECSDEPELVALDATGLLPRCTTWLGFPRGAVLRQYTLDFIELFAGHLTPRRVREAVEAGERTAIERLFADVELPLRTGCGPDETAERTSAA
ncbi:MAG: HTH-type transcriptional regulator CysB [Pseudomonadota bacterium]